jgi:hypothetical protein
MSEDTEKQEVQFTEVEEQALAHGWRPKEDFDAIETNQGKKWRSAEEFMDRKSLFDKIDDQHKKIRDLEKGVKAFAEHNKKIEQMAYDKAIKDLREQKKAAIADGDGVLAEDIAERIDEIKEQKQAAAVQETTQSGPPPEFQAWLANNTWYGENPDAKAYADGVGQQLARTGLTGTALLDAVAERTLKIFPTARRNPAKDRAVPQESGARKAPRSDGFSLTSDEERIMKSMIRAGAPISEDEYKAQIKKSRGV